MAEGKRTTGSASFLTKASRLLTAPLRVQPDFIIIGAQRCGTTSLYEYLAQHPQVRQSLYKEVRYFTDRWRLGPMFYRACFPTAGEMRKARRSGPAVTGEATPEYMFSPLALRRIKRKLPRVRLVAILRDPVERALSQYKFESRSGHDALSLEEALAAESQRLERRPDETDDHYHHHNEHVLHHSYQARGRYAEQLDAVVDLFGRDRLHVMCFETLVQDPKPHFDALLRFLGLEPDAGVRFDHYHGSGSDATRQFDPATVQKLRDYFAPHNRQLRERFGDLFPWAREGA